MYHTTMLTLTILALASMYTIAMAVLYSLCVVAGEPAPCAEYGARLQSEKLSTSSDSAPCTAPIARKKRPSYRDLPNMLRPTEHIATPIPVLRPITPCFSKRTHDILLARSFDDLVTDFDIRLHVQATVSRYQTLRLAS